MTVKFFRAIRQITYDQIDQLDRVPIETAQRQWLEYLSHVDEDPNHWDSAKLSHYINEDPGLHQQRPAKESESIKYISRIRNN